MINQKALCVDLYISVAVLELDTHDFFSFLPGLGGVVEGYFLKELQKNQCAKHIPCMLTFQNFKYQNCTK